MIHVIAIPCEAAAHKRLLEGPEALRMLAAVDRSMPLRRPSRSSGWLLATIKRWLKRRRQMGDVEVKPVPGRPSEECGAYRAWLLPGRLRVDPDLTLAGHREAFEKIATREGTLLSITLWPILPAELCSRNCPPPLSLFGNDILKN